LASAALDTDADMLAETVALAEADIEEAMMRKDGGCKRKKRYG
jgi:hypothetical protein